MTCLSLAIGVAAVLYTFSQVQGVLKRYNDAIRLAGPGRINISAKQGYVSRGLSPGLTSGDAEEIRRLWPELHMVYPKVVRWQTRLSYGAFHNDSIIVRGVTEEWRRRDWVFTQRVRFLYARDQREAARVCVLIEAGGWVHKPFWAKYFPDQALAKLLKHRDLLGKQVMLGEHLFTVVGILKEPPKDRDPRWGHEWGGQGVALVPIGAYQRFLVPPWSKDAEKVESIQVDSGDAATAGLYLRRIRALLTARHRGEQDFEIRDFREMMQGAIKRLREFIMSIMVIGIVAILASGIGIMNVTLATVFSRVREIGIRRALGATRRDIVAQFVAEAMALGLAGGVAGTLIGLAAILYLAPREDRMASLSLLHVAGALVIALGTGFFFALFPAYKASRFDPIEALRYE